MNKVYKEWYALGILVIVIISVLAVLVIGCIEVAKEETPLIPKQIGMPPTPKLLQTGVPPAPKVLYVKAGQFEQFTYWDHNITVNYISAYPTQKVKVTLDGVERILQKELTESPIGIYWKEGDLSFTLKPVVWEIREDRKIPTYESTWNTTEVYFEVFI